jgi:hypothetical protein
MARKFLYFIAFCIIIVLGVLLALRLFPLQIARMSFVPGEEFVAPAPRTPVDYADTKLWFARPGVAQNVTNWTPPEFPVPTEDPTQDPDYRPAATFFIHPTSYLNRAQWNEPADDAESRDRARNYVKLMASAFADTGPVWAPRYRQATFGSFLLAGDRTGQRALDAAYGDVLAAFDTFIAAQMPDTPIILAGHSQGSFHLVRLLKDRVAGKPLAGRIVAAYAIGWPISLKADLPALGLPACTAPDQTRCIISFQSYAEPAEYQDGLPLFEQWPGLTGTARAGDAYLCTNPLNGGAAARGDASLNLGMVKPNLRFDDGNLLAQGVGAVCDKKGFLLVGPGPNLGPFVMPGNNYHAYDYAMFWANLRADAGRRTRAFVAR